MDNKRLYELHLMIKNKSTGGASDAAAKLGISRATFFRWKTFLESLGAEIYWIHGWNTYIYGNNFNIFCVHYKITYELNGKMMEKELGM